MKIDWRSTLPNRVSRFYPVFMVVLLLLSSSLTYAWLHTKIQLEYLTANVDQREYDLKQQVKTLSANKLVNDALLKKQESEIAAATARLTELEKDLKNKSDQLATQQALLTQSEDQLKAQKNQLATNAAELESLRLRPPLFSFQNKSSLSDINQKEADVKEVITAAYDYIRNLYGQPYLLNSITITFVDSFSIEGSSGEIVIQNSSKGINIDIHLKDFDKNSFQDVNTIIHEIIHGFHGIAVFDSSALEEGMTVAATDAVMSKMIKDGKLPNFEHLYIVLSDEKYNSYNKIYKIPADNDAFYSMPDVGKIYQVIGKAWYQLYEQNPDFFFNFNKTYYPSIQNGHKADTALVLDVIRQTVPKVRSTDIQTYLSANIAFNPI